MDACRLAAAWGLTMTPLPDPSLPWPIPLPAVDLISESEGLSLVAYKCPAGVLTIGRGETEGVHPGDTCTQAQADQWLCDDLAGRAQAVRAMCTKAPTPNELGALVSLAYNIGLSALKSSSVLRCHNAADHAGAARAFALWDKARIGGVLQPLPGLTTRRAREAALYLTPGPGQPAQQMPQSVAAEPALAASPTVAASTTGVAAGALALVSQAGETVGPIKESVATVKSFATDTLGLPVDWFLPGLLLVLGGVVLWRRWGQRLRGVA